MKQKQLLVNEFKQAQEILKDKIIELENELVFIKLSLISMN